MLIAPQPKPITGLRHDAEPVEASMVFVLLIQLAQAGTTWQQPPQDLLDVLHAPRMPWTWTSPDAGHMILADPQIYPPLADFAAGWLELAGKRVNPTTGGYHDDPGGLNARIRAVDAPDADAVRLDLPPDAELHSVRWTVDGEHFALTIETEDHFELWLGDASGAVSEVEGLSPNVLVSSSVQWMPDQSSLLVMAVPDRGPVPAAPDIPAGPMVTGSEGGLARSTYEARNLLKTEHDDRLFEYYVQSQPVLVSSRNGKQTALGDAALYAGVSPSPDGRYLLAERLEQPWSHEVAWWRFGLTSEVWDKKGRLVAEVARTPLADNVPAQGVTEGPRNLSWRATADAELYWLEALDGGDPVAEVSHRDRLMRLAAPFSQAPEEVWRATHRIRSWMWGEDDQLVVMERERLRRWQTVWRMTGDGQNATLWFERSERDRYGDPGSPVMRPLPNGRWIMRQKDGATYFSGSGGSPDGDRPFLDLRDNQSGETERLFRSAPDRYEAFMGFAGSDERFLIRTESAAEPPNYVLATLGEAIEAETGEAQRTHSRSPVTAHSDPLPALRQLEKRLVSYEREDGVALSFQLYLPPEYEPGTPLPTIVHAYPREYSDAKTAGQVRGSTHRFDWLSASSPLFFAMHGYAVLYRTAMPMVGDSETVYDTFVPQLVADAEAAVTKAVELGISDPARIGIMGHSHGGLMVGNLLAHTDLFAAGVARSGSYNKTTQPFGFQSERRSLFEARDVYIQVSPTFFADQVNEPVLILHGDSDANPGTLTIQSQVFFEAVRGAGGTARLVLLPYESHGYRARETVEHVLWEQLQWFDTYVKNRVLETPTE